MLLGSGSRLDLRGEVPVKDNGAQRSWYGDLGKFNEETNIEGIGTAVLRSFEGVLFERDVKRPRRSVEYKRALVAEDNVVNQRVAMAFLKKMNFQVDIAENGEEAVTMATKQMYDVILMDCQMPVCDGYQATQEIRKFNKEIPIIALTADVVAWSKQKCIDVGMTDFISKPMTKEKLYEVLCKWIEM